MDINAFCLSLMPLQQLDSVMHHVPLHLQKICQQTAHESCWKWCDSSTLTWQAGHARMKENLEEIERLVKNFYHSQKF